jgi:hypothetical protein
MFLKKGLFLPASLCSVLLACSCIAAPQILITNLPPYASFDDLAGVVSGANPASNAMAVFIYVPGYGWVSKPTCGQPLSLIHPDGSWSADITTGGSDQLATRVAALLVQTNYNEPCIDGAVFLPTNVFSKALAISVVTRQFPSPRWLKFSGYDWWVKSSQDPVGPGPNYFSDSTNNVFVDEQGELHVRITNRSNQWQCAELVSARTFGFGNYRFELASQVDDFDPDIVLGLFTWSDDPAYADREIDIECSRWANASDTNNSQYVVQPYDLVGHLARFDVPTSISNSTHWFKWESNRVTFQSEVGRYDPSAILTNLISGFNYNGDTPQTGDENVHINLWLFNGSAPAKNQEKEVIIKNFNFVPLTPPQPALLNHFSRSSAGQFQFDIQGQSDWRYEISSSSNLLDWESLSAFLATNIVTTFVETNSPSSPRYRVQTLR